MEDFESQRREAEERVKEMNRTYRQKAGLSNSVQQKPQEEKRETKSVAKTTPRKSVDLLKMLRLDSLKGDPDRLLLLGIFLLLNSEEADEWLLYALLYIML